MQYNRINWQDRPSVATPINATNLNKMDKAIADVASELASTATKEELLVQKGRIDVFESLPEGATTNDARLEDLCVGADGKVWDSPANATRGQINLLNEDIGKLKDKIFINAYDESTCVAGYMSTTATITTQSSTNLEFTTDYIPVEIGDKVKFTIDFPTNKSSWVAYFLFNEKDQNTRIGTRVVNQNLSIAHHTFDVDVTEGSYIRYSYRTYGVSKQSILIDRNNIKGFEERITKNKEDIELLSDTASGFNNILSIARLGYNPYSPDTPPECSIASYRMAYEKGYRFMLCDLRFTSDNVPVSLHDSTINAVARNSNGTTLSSSVSIANITLAEANAYDYGLKKGEQYRGYQIPLLEDIVKYCKFTNCKLCVEIKVLLNETNMQYLNNVLKKYNLGENLAFSSTNDTSLGLLHSAYPKAMIWYGCNITTITQSRVNIVKALKGDNEIGLHVGGISTHFTDAITNAHIEMLSNDGVHLIPTGIYTAQDFSDFLLNANNFYAKYIQVNDEPLEYYLYRESKGM